jgi:O-antigen/teichoic acid export membrane protein
MVQQIIIKNRGKVSDRQLITFALSVGMLCSLLLLLGSTTPVGLIVVQSFVGNDSALVAGIRPVLLLCAFVPLLVAMQNATQGFLVGSGQTRGVNRATWIGTIILLLVAFLGVQFGAQGAIAAGVAMVMALTTEVSYLTLNLRKVGSREF